MQNKIPKIWLMRQAGRYLPEYKAVREKAGSFLNVCYNPDLAAEITMQPLKRFNLDAAIIFSDILIVPDRLGLNLRFIPGDGPRLNNIRSMDNIYKIKKRQGIYELIYETISKVRSQTKKTVIGFAGSPWTVATYMIEGQGKTDFFNSKIAAFQRENYLNIIIDIIVEETIEYLSGQIKAGAQMVQLFDSWAGLLHGEEFINYIIKPTQKIVNQIKKDYPLIPIIGFPKGAGYLYKEYIKNIDIEVIAVDQNISPTKMSQWQEQKIVQGNLDPSLLYTNKEIIARNVDKIFEVVDKSKYIFNLGHGITPSTPIENVEFLVEYVLQSFSS